MSSDASISPSTVVVTMPPTGLVVVQIGVLAVYVDVHVLPLTVVVC